VTHDPNRREAADSPGDNVRDVRYPRVAGPHYRNLFIAAGLLVAVIGASLFISPRGARQEPEAEAPAPPDRTFLDLPPAPPKAQGKASSRAPWWHQFAGLDREEPPEEEAPPQEEPSPAYPAWEEGPAEPEPPPPDPRRQAFERALRSSTLRPADRAASLAPGGAGASETDRLLAAAAAVLPAPGSLAPAPPVPLPAQAPLAGGLDESALPSVPARQVPLQGAVEPRAGALQAGDAAPHHAPPLFARRYPRPGPTTLRAGTLIPARLETGIDSDAPGPVTARVLRDVMDSATGQRVLIPAGAQLLGSVGSQLAYGDNRVLVAFERLTMPAGTYELPGLDALAAEGALGLRDRVDRHVFATLGKAVLLAALGAGFEISQPRRDDGAALSTGEIAAAQVAIELNRVVTQLLTRSFARRPTVKVRPGERFCVYVHRDLIL
jgi:type IV secretory pathway VirB10-like protein